MDLVPPAGIWDVMGMSCSRVGMEAAQVFPAVGMILRANQTLLGRGRALCLPCLLCAATPSWASSAQDGNRLMVWGIGAVLLSLLYWGHVGHFICCKTLPCSALTAGVSVGMGKKSQGGWQRRKKKGMVVGGRGVRAAKQGERAQRAVRGDGAG